MSKKPGAGNCPFAAVLQTNPIDIKTFLSANLLRNPPDPALIQRVKMLILQFYPHVYQYLADYEPVRQALSENSTVELSLSRKCDRQAIKNNRRNSSRWYEKLGTLAFGKEAMEKRVLEGNQKITEASTSKQQSKRKQSPTTIVADLEDISESNNITAATMTTAIVPNSKRVCGIVPQLASTGNGDSRSNGKGTSALSSSNTALTGVTRASIEAYFAAQSCELLTTELADMLVVYAQNQGWNVGDLMFNMIGKAHDRLKLIDLGTYCETIDFLPSPTDK